MGKLAYSVQEVSDAIGIKPHTLYDAINRGEIHSTQVGRRKVIPKFELERLLGTTIE